MRQPRLCLRNLLPRSPNCLARPSLVFSCRCFSSTPTAHDRPKSVAVLGGGITGLATAWYLNKINPNLPVTIFEASNRLGGWISTKHFETNDGKVMFEAGPRTLRPNTPEGLVTIDMIRELDLTDQLIAVSKDSLAAKNRFIYYPDRLNKLPTTLQEAITSITSPIFRGVPMGFLMEPWRKTRSPDVLDESIGDFIRRRVGRQPAENITSAIWHGIYAGDLYKLSARQLFPLVWRSELKHGNLLKSIRAFMRGEMEEKLDDQILVANLTSLNRWIMVNMQEVMAITFIRGLGTLSEKLVEELKAAENVTIKLGVPVKSLSLNNDYAESLVQVQLSDGATSFFSHAVSTLFAPTTSSLLPKPILPLASTEAVTVMVVNLYYRTPDLTPVLGFGYLIPISIPAEQNPEKALGVIFDSALIAEDGTHNDHAPGTKLTVMLGGHYWNDRATYPDEEEATQMAQNIVARHLGILEDPALTQATLQKNCIPQPTVGHHLRMQDAHHTLKKRFEGRLAVAGSSYRGVGVNDCIRSARDVAYNIWRGEEGGWTGLESFADEKWVPKRPTE